jgi:tripeptidyl-peptidase-2
MKNHLIRPVFIIFILVFSNLSFAQDWSFLDTERIGAKDFKSKYPEYNGKDAVVIILDTGVDMDTPGLKYLPDGGIKVIDVQDFSGEGDVRIERAIAGVENDEGFLQNPDHLKLFGYKNLENAPSDSIYFIGFLKEKKFVNSVIPDINNNGQTDDQFGLIVFNTEDGWLAYIDLDGDGNIDDEQPIRNYKEKFQSFQFRGRDIEKSRNLANFGLNIFPDEERVNFHFDGNGHGSHCAGIAAGYKIAGQEGLNGIAPGARIVSLKIGDGRLSGGATVTGSMIKAYEYGVEFAKKYNGPVVFSMSYGIGSEAEGLSDIGFMLDDLLQENEKLVFCTSAGNEGPGISTVGLPAASKRLLSVGAIYTPRMARDLYGANIKTDVITSFSSRGGEVNKPDVLAPGAAASTIPAYSNREVKGGTSMACPQAAGAVALLMSAAEQQNPPLPISGALLRKAINNSADPLPDYLDLEQGNGVINVGRAFEFYKEYTKKVDDKDVIEYTIDTISPIFESETGPAAYWRFGVYAPGPEDKQHFYINPKFREGTSADEKNNFYRAFNLETNQPWIKISKKSTYIKGDKAASVEVYFDQSITKTPGIYNGKIIAYRNGGNKPVNKEFELLCTVIIPQRFDEANHYAWQSGEISLDAGQIKHFFFKIPEDASAGLIRLEAVKSEYANIRAYLFDPEGRENENYLRLDTEKENEYLTRLSSYDLEPGTWEFVLYSTILNEKKSTVKAEISFSGLEAMPQEVNSVKIRNGNNPQGSFDIINHYDQKVNVRVGGSIDGIQRKQYVDESSDRFEYDFKISDEYEKVEFELELSEKTFNMFTDFSINIKDYSGKTLKTDGLTYRKHKLAWIPPASGDYILELIPGFADKEPKNWFGTLTESYHYFKKPEINGAIYNFYPDLKKTLDFTIKGNLIVAPQDYYVFGEIWLDQTDKNRFRNIIPIKLYTGMND